ncbi:Rhodanese-like domain [Carpediemonas membranifera]|uniref:Rhodanese-like domain n=1 Tax=Carpediemonas membranifera TaxID=201153 RepID=A0A8J6AT02_9EUKA|nr:Rhodanese-like domain [Carpediemonas membranifera]|eukprot:KAG9393328.1 Rhodanese-like domain [Carpediemonas membranifera]
MTSSAKTSENDCNISNNCCNDSRKAGAKCSASNGTLPGRSVEEILADSRKGITRVEPEDLPAAQARGAHVIDVRSAVTRDVEGHIPGAVVIERLVMDWRLDPRGAWRMAGAPEPADEVVVVCNEGFHSSLAARDLRELGLVHATDLVGGFRAYQAAGMPTVDVPTRYVQ